VDPMPELEMLTPETLSAIADPMGYAMAMFQEMANLRRQLNTAQALAEQERRQLLGRLAGADNSNHVLLDQLRDQGAYLRRVIAARDLVLEQLVELVKAWASSASLGDAAARCELWERKLGEVAALVGIVAPMAVEERST